MTMPGGMSLLGRALGIARPMMGGAGGLGAVQQAMQQQPRPSIDAGGGVGALPIAAGVLGAGFGSGGGLGQMIQQMGLRPGGSGTGGLAAALQAAGMFRGQGGGGGMQPGGQMVTRTAAPQIAPEGPGMVPAAPAPGVGMRPAGAPMVNAQAQRPPTFPPGMTVNGSRMRPPMPTKMGGGY